MADRDPVPILVRQADLFASLDDATGALAAQLDPTSSSELSGAAPVVAGAAVQAWLLAAGVGDGYPADQAAVGRVLAVARHESVATEVLGGWRVSRSAGRLSLTAPGSCKDAPHG